MKTTLKLTILVLVTVLGISCNSKSQSKSDAITVITPTEFKAKSVNQTIIDIRTPQEFSEGHIEGAININYFDNNFLDQIAKYDKNQPLFIYCRSGNRTTPASKKVADFGFTKIYDLEGGILYWMKNNNETVK
ncbi:MAG: rhodanese-like domain-containing protein [Bacteroidetes bacterium HGW-Bacteroidetes-3]|jgi:rhodanese-related sulfurtransferase|nr:MAG: rhodanese-like domain-containing protein [Bacteroidetes bacterium HGW-Bacteroidetes-3]